MAQALVAPVQTSNPQTLDGTNIRLTITSDSIPTSDQDKRQTSKNVGLVHTSLTVLTFNKYKRRTKEKKLFEF